MRYIKHHGCTATVARGQELVERNLEAVSHLAIHGPSPGGADELRHQIIQKKYGKGFRTVVLLI
jgi:hypothetical protein